MEYTVDYFIQKFEAIPDTLFTTGAFEHPDKDGCCCVLGHCGVRKNMTTFNYPREAEELQNLFLQNLRVGPISINDGYTVLGRAAFDRLGITQETPKERILFALNLIKQKLSQA